MTERLTLSRSKFATFLACQRRFQLRYLDRLAWPEMPPREQDEERLLRGHQFHQLLERHFLGLKIETTAILDQALRRWWQLFEKSPLALPHGRVLPELTLTIPLGRHLLNGRFDLLIIGENAGEPFAHIFDWKTGKPLKETTLHHDWQTRLYLAMLAEGGHALWDDGRESTLKPEQISMTYWYVTAPEVPQTVQYNQAWHEQNWADLARIVAQIEAQLVPDTIWPLTDDLSLCRSCAYQAFCGRQAAGTAVFTVDDDEVNTFTQGELEPMQP